MNELSLRGIVLSAALLSVLLSAPEALAFCQATTCDPTMISEMCQFDAHSCLTVGQPLAWPTSCVTVSVQATGAPKLNIDYAAAAGSVTRAFAAWTSAACAEGGTPALSVIVSGPISCGVSEYNSDRGNANIVVFREDSWPYVGGEDALGLTRVRFEVATGQIWDADIEVNAVAEPLSVGDPVPPDSVDLDSLLTHEAGHLLGLGHTQDKSATMFAGYTKGTDSLRTLAPDDVNGVCAIYPPTRTASSTSCEPRHGYSDVCAAQQPAPTPVTDPPAAPATKGCSISTSPHSASSSLLLILTPALGALALFRRRRRVALQSKLA